jgi:hypothetical protein
MSHSYFDFTKLRNESDIKAAKEKLKYCMLVQEEMLSKSIHNLRSNLVLSLKSAVIETGARIVTVAVISFLRERFNKEK